MGGGEASLVEVAMSTLVSRMSEIHGAGAAAAEPVFRNQAAPARGWIHGRPVRDWALLLIDAVLRPVHPSDEYRRVQLRIGRLLGDELAAHLGDGRTPASLARHLCFLELVDRLPRRVTLEEALRAACRLSDPGT